MIKPGWLEPFALKWNPFSPDVPLEALLPTAQIEHFCRRIEQTHVRDGGFALVVGDPGLGKSAAMRILADRLEQLPDITVGVIVHPQSNLADFYRELGDLFGVALRPHNRWNGSKALRECWEQHMQRRLTRPIVLIDEAQQMQPAVLSELRLLASTRFDSRALLSVVLAGDGRLKEKLTSAELMPLDSRIRIRLELQAAPRQELAACLQHLIATAGNPKLMTPEVIETLSEHALGNRRTLTQMAEELLFHAADREASRIDQKLFLELTAQPRPVPEREAGSRRRR